MSTRGQFYENRLTFTENNCAVRTHKDFIAKEDKKFNTGDTSLTKIPGLNLVSSVA